jgi:hypothetical protein
MRPYSHIHTVYVQDQTSAVLGEGEADPGVVEEGVSYFCFQESSDHNEDEKCASCFFYRARPVAAASFLNSHLV